MPIISEEFDEDDPEYTLKNKDIFNKYLIPLLSDDALINIEYVGERYDISINEGKFNGVSFLGYYYDNDISLEIKSYEGFKLFFELFPTAKKIDLVQLNNDINRFKFLYKFIFGKEYFHNKIETLEDIKFHFTYDGPNYSFQVFNHTFENCIQGFRVYFSFSINTLSGKLESNVTYRYTILEAGKLSKHISANNYAHFEKLFTDFFIYKQLDIKPEQLCLCHHQVLHMINQ